MILATISRRWDILLFSKRLNTVATTVCTVVAYSRCQRTSPDEPGFLPRGGGWVCGCVCVRPALSHPGFTVPHSRDGRTAEIHSAGRPTLQMMQNRELRACWQNPFRRCRGPFESGRRRSSRWSRNCGISALRFLPKSKIPRGLTESDFTNTPSSQGSRSRRGGVCID